MKDFRSRVEAERAYLLRYASLQLRDRHAAEDAVQETLLREAPLGEDESELDGLFDERGHWRDAPACRKKRPGVHDARAPGLRDRRHL